MTDRRYSEEEVAAIFARAAEAQQTPRRRLSSGDGVTLAELQHIGQEVGLPPELVSQAARSLDRGGRTEGRKFLGLPLGVGRTIEIDRRLTEPEWESLVVDLRQTFDARGSVKVDGAFRQWTNGNLQALVEPVGDGQRIRFKTTNGVARSLMTAGLGLVGAGSATLLAAVLAGGLGDPGSLAGMGFLATIGLGLFGLGAIRLPGWSRTRQRQMEGLAERIQQLQPSPEPASGE